MLRRFGSRPYFPLRQTPFCANDPNQILQPLAFRRKHATAKPGQSVVTPARVIPLCGGTLTGFFDQFFIGQPLSSQTQSGSTIYVYHEDGTLLETLNGFNFGGAGNRIAVNPATRTGFVNGPGPDQLQQFTY